jgi:hypothetical protein
MNILDISLLIIKYTPFWAVPMALMSGNFAYIYWLKDFKEMAYAWGAITSFCLTSILIYFLLGGPDQIVQTFTHIFN